MIVFERTIILNLFIRRLCRLFLVIFLADDNSYGSDNQTMSTTISSIVTDVRFRSMVDNDLKNEFPPDKVSSDIGLDLFVHPIAVDRLGLIDR